MQDFHRIPAPGIGLDGTGCRVVTVEKELERDVAIRQVQLEIDELRFGLIEVDAEPVPAGLVLLLVVQVFDVVASAVNRPTQH